MHFPSEQRAIARQEADEDERRRVVTDQAVELGQLRRVARRFLETYELASDAARRDFERIAHEAEVVLGA